MRSPLLILLLLSQLSSFSQKNCEKSYALVHKAYNSSLLDSIQNLKFETKDKKKHIPRFIKKSLKSWNHGKFRIANPNKSYNATDMHFRNWPSRRMNYLGLNESYIVLSYDHGGLGHHEHILIFKIIKKDIEEVYVLYGNIKSSEELVMLLKYFNDKKEVLINSQEF